MSAIKRVRMEICGIVQGVGMRPFLHRLAGSHHLSGWARNTTRGVELEVRGTEEDLNAFERELKESPPPLAVIESVEVWPLEEPVLPSSDPPGSGFIIRDSAFLEEPLALAPPDTAPCHACLMEMRNPKDRRYRYPFINCTDCGPRYTIIRALPYDRSRTSMAGFSMCPECSREYGDIESRRYHAQPDCCPVCGPQVSTLDREGKPIEGDAFRWAQHLLAEGKILAVKGIGGIHLSCDAANPQAVQRLRLGKHRMEKPLALMCADTGQAHRLCRMDEDEQRILESPARPILLLRKQDPGSQMDLSAGSRLGVMLPYSPIHALLLDGAFGGPKTLVMTSANLPDCPVLKDNEEALSALKNLADGFLLHNRPIENRCDDSLVMAWQGNEYFFRRSRGYCPLPIHLSCGAEGILALGAEQKASFGLGRDHSIFLSPHIGDLKNMETMEHYQGALSAFQRIFQTEPRFLACDLHPDYASSRLGRQMAEKKGLPLLQIQHHWAHMASCMAEHHLEGPVFGIIWDGTGLGLENGTGSVHARLNGGQDLPGPVSIWGAEFLRGDYRSFWRLGSIRPLVLPGGDQAALEIRRLALGLWEDSRSFQDEEEISWPLLPAPEDPLIRSMIRANISCPCSSSMGRLFDAMDCLIEGRNRTSYEGHGASMLQALGEREEITSLQPYPLHFYEEEGIRRFDTRPLTRSILKDLEKGLSPSRAACRFMDTVSSMALDQCRALNPEGLPVVLSGGVFQNDYLLKRIYVLLTEAGFTVFCHRQVPCNDQGLPLGQMAIAQRSEAYYVSCRTFKDQNH